MKALPDKKWILVQAGVLAGFGLALIVLAIASPTPPAEPAAYADASPDTPRAKPVEAD